MRKFLTGDGSFTFISSEFEEAYHSVTGAEEEAVKKFVEPTKVVELAKNGEVRILDVCFGMGYNSAAAIDAILKENPQCKISIVGLEKDKALLDVIQVLKPSFESYKLIKKLSGGLLKEGNISINLLHGDALETIKAVEGEFDVCFFDPFSPGKIPVLWSEYFFRDVASKIKKGGVLATYSCATHVRLNMVRAGLNPKDGPSVGRRAPSTIAYKL